MNEMDNPFIDQIVVQQIVERIKIKLNMPPTLSIDEEILLDQMVNEIIKIYMCRSMLISTTIN